MPRFRPTRIGSLVPPNPISDYWMGIVRCKLHIHTTDGTYVQIRMYRPVDVDMSKVSIIPCIIIVDTGNNTYSWDTVMSQYATQGFVVMVYTGRQLSKVSDMFSLGEVTDLLSIHTYIKSQFQWINSGGIFIMGTSYASGIVLRCLTTTDQPYAGGIVLSPIPYISSTVSQDTNTIPVASHACATMLLSQMGVSSVSSFQFSSRLTSSDLRAQRLLSIDQTDRLRYDLTTIKAPVYVHVNVHDTMVNLVDIVHLFDHTKKKHDDCCIRYVRGNHVVAETTELYNAAIYDDIIQWCRAVLHHGSIQTYKTEMINTCTVHTTHTSIHPTRGRKNYKLADTSKVRLYSYLPDLFLYASFLDRFVQYIADAYIPIRPLLSIQRTILWSLVFKRSLDIAGFPIVTLFVDTKTPDSGFGLTLLTYDGYGFGTKLGYKYIMLKDTHDKSKPINVRMSMVASRIRFGQELVLVVSSYDHRFTYMGRTRSTITFSDIVLPYLFEH
jgi:hypothetical protein